MNPFSFDIVFTEAIYCMFRILIVSLSLLIAGVAGAVDREIEERIMLEHIDWLVENGGYEYNGEPLPDVVYGTQEQLTAYFYGLDRYLEEGDDLMAVEGIFQSEDEGTIFLLDDFDWYNTEDLDTLVHELVHYLQYISETTYSCSVAAELEAYRYQTEWMMENPSDDIQPSYLMAIWIMETCILEAIEAEATTD